MKDIAIRVRNLGKTYQISSDRHSGRTLRDALAAAVTSPFRILTRGNRERQTRQIFHALRDVSFEIQRGEVVGVIGGNGAGKSTLLKLLSRVTEPSTGFAEVQGRVGSLLEVGTGFHPDLTGRENVFLNGAILGMHQSEVHRKFDEIVAFSEVEKFLDVPVKRYSSGMYMRLAFAVAAHLEPDLLLVDEVLAVGDVSFQRKCLTRLKQIAADSGRTVLFVSHDMQAVQSLCSRVLHMDHGRLIDSGGPRSVIGRYLAQISSAASSRVWQTDRPGDAEFRLHSVSATSRTGEQGVFRNSEDISVAIGFEAKVVRSGLCIGFDIVTPDGITVLRSYQTDMAEHDCPVLRLGDNIWHCRIPAGLLGAGEYYISPKLSIHNSYWIVNGDAVVRFEISGLFNRNEQASGIIQKDLPWQLVA